MDNTDGAANIPPITPAAEELSTLTTLKEVREKWKTNTGTTTFGGLLGFGTTATPLPPAPRGKKATRTRAPIM